MSYGRRLGGAFNDCLKIVKSLKSAKQALAFLAPVDPIALGIPDYFHVIKRPMDLGTVEANLRAGSYVDANQFAEDVRLIWSNCIQYNGADHAISQSAKQLAAIFEKKFSELKTLSFEDAGMPDAMGGKPPRVKPAVPNKKRAIPGAGGPVPMRPPENDMTFEEKRQLCIQINTLEPKYLGKVILIIHKAFPSILDGKDAGDDEVEISIESLGTSTLRELEAYVRDVKQQQLNPPQQMLGAPAPPTAVHQSAPMEQAQPHYAAPIAPLTHDSMSHQMDLAPVDDPNAMQI